MAQENQSEYEDGEEADYPFAPHVGGRYYGNRNFSYGVQPSVWSQEFGDRGSKLFVYVPQQLNLSLAGFLGGAAPAAIALVGAASHNEIAGPATGTSIGVTRNGIVPGSTISVAVTCAHGGTITNVSDGTTTISAPDVTLDWVAGTQRVAIYTFPNHAGGNKTFTATFSIAVQWRGIDVIELSNVDPVTPVIGTASASGSSATPGTGNIAPAPARDGSYIVGFALGTTALTSAGGYTDLFNDPTVITDDLEGLAQAVAANTGPSWTMTSGGWGAVAVGYQPSVAGAPLSGALSSVKNPGGVALAGGIGPAGALQKQTNRILSGGFTPGGAITRLINRALAGGFTPAGALAWARQYFSTLAGGFAPSGALTKQTSRALSGGFTPAGAVTKQASRTLAGGFTPAGVVTRSRQYFRTLTGGFTPGGVIQKLVNRALAGGFTPGGTLSTFKVKLTTLTGGFTPSGALQKLLNRALSGGVGPSGALTKQTNKTLAGATAPSGTLTKRTIKTLAGGFTPSGTVAKITVFLRTLSGGFTPTGTVTKQTNRTVSGGLVPSGAVSKSTLRNLAGALAPSGVVSKFLSKSFAGSLVPAGVLATLKIKLVALAGSLVPSGTVQRKTSKTTQGAIAPTGAVSRRTLRTLAGQIGLSGQLTKIFKKTLAGFIIPTGVLTWAAIGHDFLVLMAGVEGARYIIGALSAVRYRLESRSQSRYGPTHTGEASEKLDNNSTSKDDL